MEDTLLIDAAERFVKGEMSSSEKIYFEDLRKNNPELDQLVVEQIFFLNQLESYSQTKNFKAVLGEVEQKLASENFISVSSPKQSAKIIQLWDRYKKTIAVAASIAGIVSLFIATIISTTTKSDNNIKPLVEKINAQENKTRNIENKLNALEAASPIAVIQPKRKLDAKFRATGFMIDAANNYIVTNAHVVKEAANNLIIENLKGDEFTATAVYVNPLTDLAVLQITDSNFKHLSALPYSIRKGGAELGEQIFMLGYPKQEIVYGEGYVSAKNGYRMDPVFYQLSTSANEGNSGSPVISKSGELIGIITSRETNAQGVVFAIKSENIYTAVDSVKKLKNNEGIKINSASTLRGLDRVSQVKRMENYVFMVKGN
jgi:serine protease Do